MTKNRVEITKGALKSLKKMPEHIITNFHTWVNIVNLSGINFARIIKGYHDEGLKGERAGQRSIRLSREYRAIYVEYEASAEVDRVVEIIGIIEVREISKHKY